MLTRVLLLVQSHMKIALRTLLKNKLYSFIKIFGLAAGISSFAVLYGIVSVETGFDRGSAKLENVYRVLSVTGDEKSEEYFAKTPYLQAGILKKNFSENLIAVLRIFDYQLPLVPIAVDKNIHHEKRMLFVDDNFFDFFDLTVLKKMPDKSLKDSSVVFISERLAKKFFGSAEKALGNNLTYQYAVNLKIVGILADKQKPSHITSEIICSFSTLYTYPVMQRLENNFWNSCYTYVKLKPEIDKDNFETTLNTFFSQTQNKRYTF